jgi:tetratricopeptide (TPR) repeat protein
LAAAAMLAGVILAGCGPEGRKLSAATRPAATAEPAPLPAKALVGLDMIKPDMAVPRNPPGIEELPDQAKALVIDAEKSIAGRDHAGAVGKLERAVGYAPNSPRIRKNLGIAYAGLRNTGRADEHLRRAAELAPDDLELQLLLGRLAAAQGQHDRALLALRTATKCSAFKPENPAAGDALRVLARMLDEQGYWQAAMECYTKLSDWIDEHGREYLSRPQLKELVLQPQRLLSEKGRLLLLLRRPNEAAEMLQLAFRRDRAHMRTAGLLVDAMISTKKFGEAEKLLGELADEPSQRQQFPALANRLCLAAGDRNMPSRIWQAYRRKKHDTVDTALATSLARTAEKLGGSEQAAAILEPVMAEIPGSATVGSLLSQLYVRQGKPGKALHVLAGVLAGSGEPVPAIDDAIGEVALHLKDGAERDFAGIADADSSSAKYALHYVAGAVAGRKGKSLLAVDQMKKAIGAKDDFLPAYELVTDLLLAQQQFDEAERVSHQLRKLNPDFYLAYYLQGKVRLLRREVRPAVDALVQARTQNADHVKTWLLLAWAYERAGDYRNAEQVLGEAYLKWPSDPDVCRMLFDRNVVRGRREQAGEVVSRLLEKQPGSIVGRVMSAEFDLLVGNLGDAKAKLGDLRAEDPDDAAVKLLEIRIEIHPSEGFFYRERYLDALRRLREITRRYPANETAGTVLYQVLLQADRNVEAAEALEELHRNVPENPDIERLLLAALSSAGMHERAIQVAEGLLQENPEDISVRSSLLASLAELKRFDQAIQRAEQWMQVAQDQNLLFWHRRELLNLFEKSKRYEKAQGLLDDWIAVDQARRTPLRATKLRLYGLAEQYDEAIRYGLQWIKDSVDDTMPRDILAEVLIAAKAHDKLEALLREWIGNKPDISVERYRAILVLVMARAGRAKEAQEYAGRWIAETPYNLAPRRACVGVLIDGKKYKQLQELAETWVKQLESAAPASRPQGYDETRNWCRQTAVRSLMLQEKYAEALDRAEKYLGSDPKDLEMLQLRSNCLSELGRSKQALADMEAAHKLQPDAPGVNNNLGYSYADAGVKLSEAERMIAKAVAGNPDQVSILDSLGWVLYKQGRIRKAGGIFNDMIRQAGAAGLGHPVVYDHAGDAYYRLGWTDRALNMWQAGLDLAKKEERPSRETRAILSGTAGKLRALKASWPVKVAPLGQGVEAEQK